MIVLDKNKIHIKDIYPPKKNSCNIANLKLTYEQYLKSEYGNFSILIPYKNLLLKRCFKVSSGYVSKEKLIDVQINFWDFEVIEQDLRRDIIIGEILN